MRDAHEGGRGVVMVDVRLWAILQQLLATGYRARCEQLEMHDLNAALRDCVTFTATSVPMPRHKVHVPYKGAVHVMLAGVTTNKKQ